MRPEFDAQEFSKDFRALIKPFRDSIPKEHRPKLAKIVEYVTCRYWHIAKELYNTEKRNDELLDFGSSLHEDYYQEMLYWKDRCNMLESDKESIYNEDL